MSDATTILRFSLNGREVAVEGPRRGHLADLLREEFGLTGTHLGCEHGVCGACNVMVDGVVVRGCLMLAKQADGSEVRTIEGLTEDGTLTALQDAFATRNAAQCGFCTPGMLMTAQELLRSHPSPDRRMIREAIGGNFCRCTGYEAIVDAIAAVASGSVLPQADGHGIGASAPRAAAMRAARGAGRYTSDILPAGTLHVAFLRSPYAHARITSLDLEA